MFEKIKNYALKTVVFFRKRVDKVSCTKRSMRYVSLYALLLILCCILYLMGWSAIWFFTGKPPLDDLLKFIHEVAGASWVAVIGFLAQAFVDKNKNGVPDLYEKDENGQVLPKKKPIKSELPSNKSELPSNNTLEKGGGEP